MKYPREQQEHYFGMQYSNLPKPSLGSMFHPSWKYFPVEKKRFSAKHTETLETS